MLRKLGFENTKEVRITEEWVARDPDEYLNSILEGSPLGHSLSEEDMEVQQKILEKTRANIKRYDTPNGVRIPAECVQVFASKPANA